MVTLSDIAKVLAVSKSTISRALNDHHHTSNEMKLKVRQVAKELGYVPNALARGLNNKRSKSLGLICPYPLSDWFSAGAYHSIDDRILGHGYNVFVCHTNDDKEREKLHLDQLKEKRVDGIIMIPASANYIDDRPLRESMESCRKLGIPVVFIDKYLPDLDVDYVVTDERQGAHRLVEHLISLGHRRIGFIGGYDSTSIRHKLRGYRRALEDAGLAYEQRLVKNAPFGIDPAGWEANVIRELLAEDGLTAVLVNDERTTLRILQAAHDKISSGELDIAEFCSSGDVNRFWLPVAKAKVRVKDMGRMATEIIMKYWEGDERTQRREIALSPELIFRPAGKIHDDYQHFLVGTGGLAVATERR